jgi:hypothetical protein
MIPWQAPDSSVQGILQRVPIDPPWDRDTWGIDGNFYQCNWIEGQALEDFLQQYTAAVCHLDGPLVRPRWQDEPPNIPPFGQPQPLDIPPPETPCWAAVGIVRHRPLGTYAWVGRPETDEVSELQRHEELEVLVTHYGPEADTVAGRMRSNLSVWQNIALLRLVGLAYVETGESVWAPELVKERWLNRVDTRLIMRRIVRRSYPILAILEACVEITCDPGGYRVQICAPGRVPEPPGPPGGIENPPADHGGPPDPRPSPRAAARGGDPALH